MTDLARPAPDAPTPDPRPQMRPSRDGIYPRCVWCRGENYALAVLAYSRREVPCAAAGGCGRLLPVEYVRLASDPDQTPQEAL